MRRLPAFGEQPVVLHRRLAALFGLVSLSHTRADFLRTTEAPPPFFEKCFAHIRAPCASFLHFVSFHFFLQFTVKKTLPTFLHFERTLFTHVRQRHGHRHHRCRAIFVHRLPGLPLFPGARRRRVGLQ